MAAKDKEKQDLTPAADAPGTALSTNVAYAEFEGQGFENQTRDDYSIPFLTILQALSPQLLPEAGNDHLKQGMIYNTVTGDYFSGKDGIAFVPSTTSHEFIEFKPRDQGGGFVGRHALDSDVVARAKKAALDSGADYGKFYSPEGNELIETFAVYGVAVDADGGEVAAVLAFNATKIKKYKAWMTKAKTIQLDVGGGRRIVAPLFAHRYRLKTVGEKNNKGSFFNWDISFDGANAAAARLAPTDPLFRAAVDLKALIDSGAGKANYEAAAEAGAANGDEAGETGGKPKF